MDDESDGAEPGPWAWSRNGDSISPGAQHLHGIGLSPVSPVHRRIDEAQKFAGQAEEMLTQELARVQLDLKHVTSELLASKKNAVQLERRLQHEQIRRVMELRDAEGHFQVAQQHNTRQIAYPAQGHVG